MENLLVYRVRVPVVYADSFAQRFGKSANSVLQSAMCHKLGIVEFVGVGPFFVTTLDDQPCTARWLLRSLQQQGHYNGDTGWIAWKSKQFGTDDPDYTCRNYRGHPVIIAQIRAALRVLESSLSELACEAMEDKLLWKSGHKKKMDLWVDRWHALQNQPIAKAVLAGKLISLQDCPISNPYILQPGKAPPKLLLPPEPDKQPIPAEAEKKASAEETPIYVPEDLPPGIERVTNYMPNGNRRGSVVVTSEKAAEMRAARAAWESNQKSKERRSWQGPQDDWNSRSAVAQDDF